MAYAASNAYLDAEAQRQNRIGAADWISINWDAWDFSVSAGAADAINAAQGQEAFRRILAASLKQVVVAASPLNERLDKWVNLKSIESSPAARPAMAAAAVAASSNGGGGVPASSNGGVHARPELSTQYVAPRSANEKEVAGVWEHLLGVAPIGVYDKFFELGGHSLLAIQLLARLREIFEIDLPVQRIFEAPTVAELAESIERDLKAAPVVESLAGSNGGNGGDNLAEMLSMIDGLSEAELDALLSEAEEMHKESHG
jgi:acyl carrier protein